MALSWSTFKLLPTKVHEEPFFFFILAVANFFGLLTGGVGSAN